MKDIRPYMINAHIQWLDDSGARPHLVIENGPNVKVPVHLSAQPVISFLVTSGAVQKLVLDEDGMSFVARFNGQPFTVFAPLDSLVGLIGNNGEIQIPLKRQSEVQNTEQEAEPIENAVPQKQRPELKVLEGGASGDGVPKAVLSVIN